MSRLNLYCLVCVLLMAFPLIADDFQLVPEGTYEQRREAFMEFASENDGEQGRYCIFPQISRMESGVGVREDSVRKAIDFIYSNRDCNDFTLGGILRMNYLNKKKPQLSAKLLQEIETCALDFKYWWNDARRDTIYRCYHTENHQALCHSDELLAGQLFKDKKFVSGKTGKEHIEHAIPLLKKWMDYKFRFGFSEWLSTTYYDVDILILTNLYDFAEDPSIRKQAGSLLDALFYDMALNNFHGAMGCSHGRAYAHTVKGCRKEPTSSILKLVFGVGSYNMNICMGAASLISSGYRCPEIIQKIAVDYSTAIRNRQRLSINVQDAPKYGLSYGEDDLNLYWGMQEFIHPMTVRASKKVSEKYDVWPYRDYDKVIRRYDEEVKNHGKIVNYNVDCFAMSEANVETYRTPEYMLSCVNDFRPGSPGYQQHIWQSTLGVDAVVFTTHPGGKHERGTPNYWAGNAVIPRAVQHENVVICIYNPLSKGGMNLTHAYFPKIAFDETIQKGNWTFGRKGDGFVALYSCNPVTWKEDMNGVLNDLVAEGRKNTWICEMGSRGQYGNFNSFVEKISSSQIECDSIRVSYQSPSQGKMKFGWADPFEINGKAIDITGYPRFDNPFSQTDFNSRKIKINYKGKSLTLDEEYIPGVTQAPRIVNIINFIRQCEPRSETITEEVLYQTVVSQINQLKQYNLPGTFLLQYDALINPRYPVLLKNACEMEAGAWWEITQPHVEAAGLKWRGRYSWDWHANVGFATGYTPEEREKLVDTYMEKFKSIFGHYPKSVGSWFIDAHTLAYMYDKYQITASCNCKDQIGTDGYTLWGGYWNQAYYPSRKNAYMPAQTEKGQIGVPIFRMLGSDPIYQYDNGLGGKYQGVISLEPVYKDAGGNRQWVEWFLKSITDESCLAFNYTQAGQENSFTWKDMKNGLEIQIPMLDSLRRLKKIQIQTLEESGKWFKEQFPVTPPTAIAALTDIRDEDNKTVWFNSRYYRANLLWKGSSFRFRDIHLFDEKYQSDYLTKAGTSTQCIYTTLPFVDGFMWSTNEVLAGLKFVCINKKGIASEILMDDPVVTEISGKELLVECKSQTGELFRILFKEDRFEVSRENSRTGMKWVLELQTAPGKELPFVSIDKKEIKAKQNGFDYNINCSRGKIEKSGKSTMAVLRLVPETDKLEIDCSVRR